jgi:hypothetical protein
MAAGSKLPLSSTIRITKYAASASATATVASNPSANMNRFMN